MLIYYTSTLLLIALAISVEAGDCFSTLLEDIETNPKKHPMRDRLIFNFQVQSKPLLAKSRITFAEEIQEVKEEFENLGLFMSRETQNDNDAVLMSACSSWAITNFSDILCPS
jgi:hypothetical protein